MAALKPAEIASIELDRENKRARVIVPEDQLSLAIGKKGQNVRLASKLSGWDLDIVSVAEAAVLPSVEAVEIDFTGLPGIGEHAAKALGEAGIRTLRDVFDAGEAGLTAVEGIGPAKAAEIAKYASELYEQLASEAMSRARAGAKDATPPTPRQILESMLPDSVETEPEETPAAPEDEEAETKEDASAEKDSSADDSKDKEPSA
jgi:N utilization substance protein A